MNAAHDLHRLVDRALGHDPHDALLASRLLTEESSGWLTDRAVLESRRTGKSWAMIARTLRLSRQAVHRRFRHLDQIASIGQLPRRPDSTSPTAAADRRIERMLSEARADRRRDEWIDSGDAVPW